MGMWVRAYCGEGALLKSLHCEKMRNGGGERRFLKKKQDWEGKPKLLDDMLEVKLLGSGTENWELGTIRGNHIPRK